MSYQPRPSSGTQAASVSSVHNEINRVPQNDRTCPAQLSSEHPLPPQPDNIPQRTASQTNNLNSHLQLPFKPSPFLDDQSVQSDLNDPNLIANEDSQDLDFLIPSSSKPTSPLDDSSLLIPSSAPKSTPNSFDDSIVNNTQFQSLFTKAVHFESNPPDIVYPEANLTKRRTATPITPQDSRQPQSTRSHNPCSHTHHHSPTAQSCHHHHHHHHSVSCSHSHSHSHNPTASDNFDSLSVYSSYSANHSWAATSLVSIGTFSKKFIGSFHHAPSHIQMPNIFTGYRMNYKTIKDCFSSLFELHNETSACWSHILGMFLFLVLLIYRYNTILYLVEDRFLFWTYIYYYIGSAICMMFSFSFHLFCCMNKDVHDQFYQLDMTGILLMIIANMLHPMVLTFYCNESGIGVKYALAALVCGTILAIIQNVPFCLQPRFFVYRISAIIIYGAAAILPFVQFHWIGTANQLETIGYTLHVTFTIYGLGVLFWIFKFPECFFVNIFDLGLYSHAIWHCCIIIGSLWTEQGFIHVLVRVVDQTWCPVPSS